MLRFNNSFYRQFVSYISTFAYLFVLFFAPLTANAENHVVSAPYEAKKNIGKQEAPFAVKLYIIRSGDTLSSLAKHYNLSEKALLTLNKSNKSFNHGKGLKVGQGILVPQRPLSESTRHYFEESTHLTKIKNWLNGIATYADQDLKKINVKKTITDKVSSEVSSGMKDWLTQFGTARVNLNITDDFSFRNSNIELLFPFYESNNVFYFTQAGLHRSDERWQGNLGFGTRRFYQDYMFGVNGFVDHDMTRSHTRLGAGMELWRDYLRFAANVYLRLTDWQNNSDNVKYKERPANGWDLRAEAYVPMHPQLGFNAEFAQYYGDVLLNGGKFSDPKSLLTDPFRFVFGVKYTPIPLVNLNLDHNMVKGVRGDTRFGAEVTYRFGVPFAQQIDFNAVESLRTMKGGRYDLVSRNNDIILEYKRSDYVPPNAETFNLVLEPANITLFTDTEETDIKIRVTDPSGNLYNIDEYDLSYKVEKIKAPKNDTNKDYATYFGALKIESTGVALLPIKAGAVVEDLKLTVTLFKKKSVQANISVIKPDVSQFKTTFNIEPATIYTQTLAKDAKKHPEAALITLTLQDATHNYPIIGLKDKISFYAKDSKGEIVKDPDLTISNPSSILKKGNETGGYQAEVKGTLSGKYTIFAQYGSKDNKVDLTGVSAPLTVKGTGENISKDKSTIIPSKSEINADGVQKETLTFTALDKNGKPIQDIDISDISFIAQNEAGDILEAPAFTIGEIKEDSEKPGIYKAEFYGKKAAKNISVFVKIKGKISGIKTSVSLTAKNNKINGSNSSFSILPERIQVGSGHSAKITLIAKDESSNLIEHTDLKRITFSLKDDKGAAAASTAIHYEAIQEDTGNPGTYYTTLSGDSVGKYTVTVLCDGDEVALLKKDVELTLDPPTVSKQASSFDIEPKEIKANNIDKALVTFSARDENGSTLELTPDRIKFNILNSKGVTASETDIKITPKTEKAIDVYKAFITGQTSDVYTITPIVDEKEFTDFKKTITLYGDIDETRSNLNLTKSVIEADNKSFSELELFLEDNLGKPIDDLTANDITFVVKDSNNEEISTPFIRFTTIQKVDNKNFTAHISSNKADTYTIIPVIKNHAYEDLKKTLTVKGSNALVSALKSKFALSPESIKPDKKDKSVLSLILKDKGDNFLSEFDLKKITFKVTGKDETLITEPSISITDIKRDSSAEGKYVANLSGSVLGDYKVTPVVNGIEYKDLAKKVTFVFDYAVIDVAKSDFTILKAEINADDKMQTDLILKLKDKSSHIISKFPAKDIVFIVKDKDDKDVSSPKVTIDLATEKVSEPGTYIAKIKGQKAGIYTIYPKISQISFENSSETIELTSENASIDKANSQFTIAEKSIIANNTAIANLSFRIRDKFDNGISGIKVKDVKFTKRKLQKDVLAANDITNDITIENVAKDTSEDGLFTAQLKGKGLGEYVITPVYKNVPITEKEKTISLIADPHVTKDTKVQFSIDPSKIQADDSAEAALKLTVKDISDNPLTGLDLTKIEFKVFETQGNSDVAINEKIVKIGPVTIDNSALGVYLSSLKGVKQGLYKVIPSIDGVDFTDKAQNVTLSSEGNPVDQLHSESFIVPHEIQANDSQKATLTLNLKDKDGNTLKGIAPEQINLNFERVSSSDTSPVEGMTTEAAAEDSESPGKYHITIKGKKAGRYKITPIVSGTELPQLIAYLTFSTSQSEIDKTKSKFDLSKKSIDANNEESTDVTLVLRDKFDNLLKSTASSKIDFHLKDENDTDLAKSVLSFTQIEEKEDGSYQLKILGHRAGTYKITPFIGTKSLDSEILVLSAHGHDVDPDNSKFIIKPSSLAADGETEASLRLTLKDKYNNPLSDLTAENISFNYKSTTTNNKQKTPITITLGTIDSVLAKKGIYTATLKGTRADTYEVTPCIKGKEFSKLKREIILSAENNLPSVETSSFIVSDSAIKADDHETGDLTLTLKDAFENESLNISEKDISFSVLDSNNAPVSEPIITIIRPANSFLKKAFNAKIKGQKPGVYTITPNVKGNSLDDLKKTITFTLEGVDVEASNSNFIITPEKIKADGDEKAKLALTLQDKFRNALNVFKNEDIQFIVKALSGEEVSADNISITGAAQDKTSGIYNADLSGKKPGTYIVTPKVKGSEIPSLLYRISLTTEGLPIVEEQSDFTLVPDSIKADDLESSTLTFRAVDSNDSPIEGLTSDRIGFEIKDKDNKVIGAPAITITEVTTKAASAYTVSLKGQRSGTYSVTPIIDGQKFESRKKSIKLTNIDQDSSEDHSSFEITPNHIKSDDTDQAKFHLILRDSFGYPLEGVKKEDVRFIVKEGNTEYGPNDITLTIQKDDKVGEFHAVVHAKRAGKYIVIPKVKTKELPSIRKELEVSTDGMPPSETNSSFSIDKIRITADDTDMATLTLNLKDSNNNPLKRLSKDKVKFIIENSDGDFVSTPEITVTDSVETPEDSGTYIVTLLGRKAGDYVITPEVKGRSLLKNQKHISLTTDNVAISEKESDFTLVEKEIAADDQNKASLDILFKDKFENLLDKLDLGAMHFEVKTTESPANTLSGTIVNAPNVTIEGIVRDLEKPGHYKTKLRGQLAGAYEITPIYRDQRFESLKKSITLKANKNDFSKDRSTFEMSSYNIQSNDTVSTILSFTIKDRFGNPLDDITLSDIKFDIQDSAKQSIAAPFINLGSVEKADQSKGVYKATITAQRVDVYNITPIIKATRFDNLNKNLTVTSDGLTANQEKTEFEVPDEPLLADNWGSSVLRLFIKDSYGNPLKNVDPATILFEIKSSSGEIITDVRHASIFSTRKENADAGLYLANLKGSIADTYTVTPIILGTRFDDKAKEITLTSEGKTSDENYSEFSIANSEIKADGSEKTQLTLVLKDNFGNPLATIDPTTISFEVKDDRGTITLAPSITYTPVTKLKGTKAYTAEDSTYISEISGVKAGTYTVKPMVNNVPLNKITRNIKLTTKGIIASEEYSLFVIKEKEIPANDTTQTLLTLTILDDNNNPLTDLDATDIKFVVYKDGVSVNEPDVKISDIAQDKTLSHVYTANLRGQKAGKFTVTPYVDNVALTGKSEEIVLHVKDALADEKLSNLTITPKKIKADNEETATFELTLRDRFDNPLTGIALNQVEFIANNGRDWGSPHVTKTSVEESSEDPGVYTINFSGIKALVFEITPKLRGVKLMNLVKHVELTTQGIPPTQANSEVELARGEINADNEDYTEITLKLKDVNNNPVVKLSSDQITFQIVDADGETVKEPYVSVSTIVENEYDENKKGYYTAKIFGQKSGKYKITPIVSNVSFSNKFKELTLTANNNSIDEKFSKLSLDKYEIPTNDRDFSVLSLFLEDQFGNPIETYDLGKIKFEVSTKDRTVVNSPNVTIWDIVNKDAKKGLYQAKIRGQIAGIYNITPVLDKKPYTKLTNQITLSSDNEAPNESKSQLVISPDSIKANDQDAAEIIASLKDQFGNPIRNIDKSDIKFLIYVDDDTKENLPEGLELFEKQESAENPGNYSIKIKGTKAKTYNVKVIVKGVKYGGNLQKTLTLEAKDAELNEVNSTFKVEKKRIANNNEDKTIVTLSAKDAHKNKITDMDLTKLNFIVKDSDDHNVSASDISLTSIKKADKEGDYTAELKGKLSGTYIVYVEYKGTLLRSLSDSIVIAGRDIPINQDKSSFTADPKEISVDGSKSSILTFTAKDNSDKPIANIPLETISFVVKGSDGKEYHAPEVVVSRIKEHAKAEGIYTAELKGIRADVYKVYVRYNGTDYIKLYQDITLSSKGMPINDAKSSLLASPQVIIGNNDAEGDLLFTARDEFGNPLTDLDLTKLSFILLGSNGKPPSSINVKLSKTKQLEGEPGLYYATVKSNIFGAGKYTVRVLYDGRARDLNEASLEIKASGIILDPFQSKFHTSEELITANGEMTSQITLEAKSLLGSYVTEISSTFFSVDVYEDKGTLLGNRIGSPSVTVSSVKENPKGSGFYTFSVKGIRPGKYKFYLKLLGLPIVVFADAPTVEFK